jgi:nitrogen regulatory protein PII
VSARVLDADGDHVVVFTVEDAVRIRTGESAARAA